MKDPINEYINLKKKQTSAQFKNKLTFLFFTRGLLQLENKLQDTKLNIIVLTMKNEPKSLLIVLFNI